MLERPPAGATNDGRAGEDILRATAPVQQLRVTAADGQMKAHETEKKRNSSSERRYHPHIVVAEIITVAYQGPQNNGTRNQEEEANKNGGRRGYGRHQKNHTKRRASLSSSLNTSSASPLPKVTKFCISSGKNWYCTICHVKERRIVSLKKICVWVTLSPHAVVSLHISYA